MLVPLKLPGNIAVNHGALSRQFADMLAYELQTKVGWDVGKGKSRFGEFTTPRYVATMFDIDEVNSNHTLKERISKSWNYSKSETNKNVMYRWTPCMSHLRMWIEHLYGIKIAYSQFNWYPESTNHASYHVDAEMSPTDIVVSVSLGASRHFSFRDKSLKKGPPEVDIAVHHGTIVHFDQNAGKINYEHQVRKSLVRDEYVDPFGYGRFNITLRTVN